jgi:hypothetical protein
VPDSPPYSPAGAKLVEWPAAVSSL